MKPFWVTWYEMPRAGDVHSWVGAEDARAWETGWRWCDGYVRCVAVVFAPDADAARARVQELVVGPVEWSGRPIEMEGPPPNRFMGAERWWDEMTSRRAA